MKKLKTEKPGRKIKTAKTAGVCFGVKRAIELAQKTARNRKKVYTLGPLIHNPQEVNRLSKNGIKPIKSPWKLKNETLILRTHGIPLTFKKKLELKRLNLVDAACPFVKHAQDMVRKLTQEGYQVIIVGDKIHPEVVALVSYGLGKCKVVEKKEDINKIKLAKKIGVVSQTTQSKKNFDSIISVLRNKRPDAKIFNTICRATIDRQSEAKNIAKGADLMIVVGGKNSANTRRLYEICRDYTKAYYIEVAKEINPEWFKGVEKVGLTAGASTPDWVIKDVESTIKYIKEN
ncbi:MAG: 4-hydroxy-3-methylbut-2-enyl diphosphate reductase [Elusimicrobia bacterium]|nr:4-hydroxy-3-methylbut-2-enyl diphosphate reductase [Candidatus Liberimonas magnetica]